MALPALTRTWQFQVNQVVAGGGSGLATCQALMFAISQSLVGAGAWTDSAGGATASAGNWVVDYSCDSVTAGAKGDGVNRWAAAGNLVWANAGTAHSWIVLRQTGIGATFELLISLENGGAGDAVIAFSVTGFTGGTTLARPTAADEVPLLNPSGTQSWGATNTAAIASTLHVLKTADGKSTRVLICRNGFVPGYWIFEQPDNVPTGYSTPAVGCVLGDGTIAPATSRPVFANVSNVANAYGRTSENYAAFLTSAGDVLHGLLAINQTVPSDMGASWPLFETGAYSVTTNSRGRNGKVVDHWTTAVTLVDSDTFPAAGTNNFVVFGDTVQPWNTTVPIFGGGVSTARDGDLFPLAAFASAGLLSPAMGGPDAATTTTAAVRYLMEAWDSVTGLQVTWLTDAPDFSGVFWPTGQPGLPTNTAIAAVVPP